MRAPIFGPFPSIVRIRVQPDDPKSIVGPRPRGSRRPHKDATVAEVRRLIEETVLTYAQIAAKTGVACASICRWTRDQNWQRPVFAPRATDTVPRARASARLKRRTLAARLSALAERHVRELEETPGVDLDKLAEALELMKMAKLAARPKRRRVRGTARDTSSPYEDPAQKREAHLGPQKREARLDPDVLARLRAAGVDPDRAPPDAVTDFIDSHAPPRDFPELRPRGHRSRRNREHARMLERE